MELTVLGSSSKGNCYILQNESEALIIEAGVRLKEVKKALSFNMRKIAGCLISHGHGDHSIRANEYQGANIEIFASIATAVGADIKPGRLLTIFKNHDTFQAGGFTIKALEVNHDVECHAFLIRHSEIGLMLFATDTYYLPYVFGGLTNVLIEANYSREILRKNIDAGRIPAAFENRVIQSHFEISDTIKALKANDLSKVNNIVLLHLSDGNSDAADFKKRVHAATGKTVYVAEKGLKVELNKHPF